MRTRKNTKKGISLIVLVITIIVMIVLGAAVILSLNNTRIIEKSNKAKLKWDFATMQENATLYFSSNYRKIDENKEYLITEFGMTGEGYSDYEAFVVIKAGKVYIKPNAPKEMQEVAKELNILIEGTASSTGSLALSKRPMNLKIYGNSVQNGTPSTSTPVKIENVGDKSKNIWDEEWELGNIDNSSGANLNSTTLIRSKNFIETEPNTSYYFNNTMHVFYYDGNKNFISKEFVSGGTTKTTPGSCHYIRFRTAQEYGTIYNDDIMINVSDSTVNGVYESYGYKVPVTMMGKNLFDYKNVYSNFNINNGEVIATAEGFHETKFYIPKQYIGKQLTFSVDVKKSEETTVIYLLAYINGNMMTGSRCYTNDTFTRISITMTPETENDYLCITYGNGKSGNVYAKNFQLEEGSLATEYNSYFTPINTTIYLSEPLRKVGNVADYIDLLTGEVVRYIKVKDESGTLSIEKSFEVLSTPVSKKISIEKIDFKNIKNIFVNTKVIPSNIEAIYQGI